MWGTCGHVSRPCELGIALDLFLTSFHSVTVGFAILCSQHWISVNINASMVAFIEIWGNCPCLFCMLTNMTLNRLGFGMLIVGNQLYFDCICWLVPVTTDTCSSVFIRSNIVWNWWEKIHKSVPEPRNGKLCKFCLLYSSGEILKSVTQSLFTLTINEHTSVTVFLYLCFQRKIMYIKYAFSN